MEDGQELLLPHVLLQTAIFPKWAVIILTYKRLERFFVCFRCLCSAIVKSKLAVQIIVMDNAPLETLKSSLIRYIKTHSRLINVIYAHYPYVNQSVLRNTSLTFLPASVEKILFLDSDIYVSSQTFNICNQFFANESSVVAIAPPLAPYAGGSHNVAREKVMTSIVNKGEGLIMPSKDDYILSKSRQNDYFLEPLMLRGVFAVRRECLKEVFYEKPWLPAFDVWQNVPFFLTLSEMGKVFGYILDPTIIALHDERIHKDTIASSLPSWSAQTVKSLVLLFYRNKLWLPQQQTINHRFLETISLVLTKHTSLPSPVLLPALFKLARYLPLNETQSLTLLQSFQKIIRENKVLNETISLLLKISQDKLNSIKSHDLTKPM